MVELARNAEALESQNHLRANVGEGVVRRRRKIALFLPDGVTEARLAGVPMALGGVECVVGGVDAEGVRDLVEDEELALGAEVRRVGDSGGKKVLLGAPGDPSRIAVVGLPRYRIRDLADERQRRLGRERI